MSKNNFPCVINSQDINKLWDFLMNGESKRAKASLKKIRENIEIMPENRQIEIYSIILDGLINVSKSQGKKGNDTKKNNLEGLSLGIEEPLTLRENFLENYQDDEFSGLTLGEFKL